MPTAAKPVSGTELQTETQALHGMGSPNLESAAGSGFAATQQGPTAQSNVANDLPTNTSTTPAASTTLGTQNAGVGNTASQTNTAGQINSETNQQLLNPASPSSGNTTNQTGASGSSSLLSLVGGAKNLLGLGSNISSAAGGPSLSSLTSGMSMGATGAINDFGASAFGTGGGTAGYVNAAGDSVAAGSAGALPVTAGQDASLASGGGDLASVGGASPSLTGYFGSAGVGAAIGSVYGNLSGLKGANTTNADIGGAAGGVAGGLAGGAVLGAEFGSAAGPIGTVLGGVAGAIIGGLFGPNSDPTNADAFGGTIGNLEKGNINETSKNAGATAGLATSSSGAFINILNSASTQLGFTPNPNININGGISTKHPGPGGDAVISVSNIGPNPSAAIPNSNGGGGTFYNPSSPTSTANAYFSALEGVAAQSGYTDMSALSNWFYGGTTSTSPTSTANVVGIAPAGSPKVTSIGNGVQTGTNSNVNIAPQA